ncbi:hypothetical protein CORC01_10857 [Colletotrichum orchidophilum]|uniref:BZIP domain-containing protein n=1 Tax=Colletotrichum orchidophilum TaxID=1209926 RepID=A0A1G4AXJ1_9PEZI|nr:uncharacterized protein CORC01_10857 [Colletotrichum orchidophilum]OHE93836.1 hypothetical protein CORC01_10857 [Colletotrichum orchidophilum]
MSPTDAEARRRERGVIAQREYRKRHASKVQRLEDENRKLKDAIAEINRTLKGRGHLSDDLKAALSHARGLADISEDDAVEHAGAQDVVEEEEEGPLLDTLARTPTPPSLNRPTLEPQGSSKDFPSGRLSPRLDYGLWLDPDRLIRVLEPPIDIVPYLGPGMHTLAGCIFWSTMNYAVELWDARPSMPAIRALDRVFNHSKHLSDRKYLLSLAQARMDYKNKGYMFRKLSDQFAEQACVELGELVREDYEKGGRPKGFWKTPEEVAGNILGQITTDQAVRLQAVVEGKGTPNDGEMMQGLVSWLSQNHVCFGDGPRWSAICVSVGVGGWIRELMDRDARAEEEAFPESTETPS